MLILYVVTATPNLGILQCFYVFVCRGTVAQVQIDSLYGTDWLTGAKISYVCWYMHCGARYRTMIQSSWKSVMKNHQ